MLQRNVRIERFKMLSQLNKAYCTLCLFCSSIFQTSLKNTFQSSLTSKVFSSALEDRCALMCTSKPSLQRRDPCRLLVAPLSFKRGLGWDSRLGSCFAMANTSLKPWALTPAQSGPSVHIKHPSPYLSLWISSFLQFQFYNRPGAGHFLNITLSEIRSVCRSEDSFCTSELLQGSKYLYHVLSSVIGKWIPWLTLPADVSSNINGTD